MPGLLNKIFGARAPFSSSQGYRNTQRGSAMAAIVTSSVQNWVPAAIIPTKVVQGALAAYSVFRTDTHVAEKVVSALQGLTAGAQLGLTFYFFIQNNVCDNEDSLDTTCRAYFLLEYLYNGLLSIAWPTSEFSKDPYTVVAVQNEVAMEQAHIP